MVLKVAFFDGDDLLAAAEVLCRPEESILRLAGKYDFVFEIKTRFEEPACPVFVTCFYNGVQHYRSAMRMGVHSSEDWESLSLGGIHSLVFKRFAY